VVLFFVGVFGVWHPHHHYLQLIMMMRVVFMELLISVFVEI
jgi:hypothetical protein